MMKSFLFFIIFNNVLFGYELCNYPNTDLCLGFSTKIPQKGTWIQVKSRLGAILKNSTIPQWTIKNITLENSNFTLEGDKYAQLGLNTTKWGYFQNKSIHFGGKCLTIMQCQAEGKPFCNPRSELVTPPGGKAKKGSYLQWRPCSFTEAQTFVINPLCSPGCLRGEEGSCKKECQTKYCLKGRNITCTSSPTFNATSPPTRVGKVPTYHPSKFPTPVPTFLPSSQPTAIPFLADQPTAQPTHEPTLQPSSKKPTNQPSHQPTSHHPTKTPTSHPTSHPTTTPTYAPSTLKPTESPIMGPPLETGSPVMTGAPTTKQTIPLSYEWKVIIALSVMLLIMTCFLACTIWLLCTMFTQKDKAGVASPPKPLPPLDILKEGAGESDDSP